MVLVCRLVDLSVAVRYEGAELNSCLLERSTAEAVLPDDLDVESTPAHLPLTPPTHLSALTAAALTVRTVFTSGADVSCMLIGRDLSLVIGLC